MFYANASAGAPDPYLLTESASSVRQPNNNIIGKTVSDPRLIAGESTGVFIIGGDSMAGNHHDTAYVPTNATKVDQVNLYSGGTYRAVDPLLGCTATSGNIFSRVADKLVTAAVFDRVILMPVGITGSLASEWDTDAIFTPRLIVAAKRLASVGLTTTAFLWSHGPNDKAAGTSQASYTASLNSIINRVRTAGYSAPWLVAQCSFDSGASGSAVRAAQAAVVAGTIYAGPDMDSVTGSSNRQSSGNSAHFTAAGADLVADLWKAAIDAVF